MIFVSTNWGMVVPPWIFYGRLQCFSLDLSTNLFNSCIRVANCEDSSLKMSAAVPVTIVIHPQPGHPLTSKHGSEKSTVDDFPNKTQLFKWGDGPSPRLWTLNPEFFGCGTASFWASQSEWGSCGWLRIEKSANTCRLNNVWPMASHSLLRKYQQI